MVEAVGGAEKKGAFSGEEEQLEVEVERSSSRSSSSSPASFLLRWRAAVASPQLLLRSLLPPHCHLEKRIASSQRALKPGTPRERERVSS